MTTHRTEPSAVSGNLAAKQPLSPAAGPYGHPFHPMLVTVPIGAWVASLVFDLATHVASDGSPSLTAASSWLVLIGLVGAVLAAGFGFMDLLRIPPRTQVRGIALTHMTLNLVVVVLYAVSFAWRRIDGAQDVRVAWGQVALSVISLAILGASGWLGGQLAYRYGVRVADEDTQAQGYRSVG